jgi:hypothetical protein
MNFTNATNATNATNYVNATNATDYVNATNATDYVNVTNATDYTPIDDKDISEIIPFILLCAIVVFGIVVSIIMCRRENKHQTNYAAAVSARKRGDKVEWV